MAVAFAALTYFLLIQEVGVSKYVTKVNFVLLLAIVCQAGLIIVRGISGTSLGAELGAMLCRLIGVQHQSIELSNRSRDTLMLYTDRSAQSRFKSNKSNNCFQEQKDILNAYICHISVFCCCYLLMFEGNVTFQIKNDSYIIWHRVYQIWQKKQHGSSLGNDQFRCSTAVTKGGKGFCFSISAGSNVPNDGLKIFNAKLNRF